MGPMEFIFNPCLGRIQSLIAGSASKKHHSLHRKLSHSGSSMELHSSSSTAAYTDSLEVESGWKHALCTPVHFLTIIAYLVSLRFGKLEMLKLTIQTHLGKPLSIYRATLSAARCPSPSHPHNHQHYPHRDVGANLSDVCFWRVVSVLRP